MSEPRKFDGRWYEGVTPYQWLVLVIASLGWVFDQFESQIYIATSNEALPDLLPGSTAGEQQYAHRLILAGFLIGGALGGVLFGWLADRFGRTRALAWTILVYSACTGLSALAQSWWQLAALRFLVALGVGGEWAVASAFVAEVFPARARAHSQAIFHASSVLGIYLAIAAAALLVPGRLGGLSGWRIAFALGLLPALLTLWVRLRLREPEAWVAAREAGPATAGPGVAALFAPAWRRRTLVGVGLATVGLATFWGTYIYGKDLMRRAYAEAGGDAAAVKRGEMLGMLLVTTGGGLGLVAFGPLAERLGRRGAFALFQLGGLAAALATFHLVSGVSALLVALPVFGFLTLGMHAGYAVYFPELFPTHLRGTGSGFCFNAGRLLAAPLQFFGGLLQLQAGLSLETSASLVSLLFLPGLALLAFAPETRGRPLPD